MRPQWVIEKKRDGGTLSPAEIRSFVDGFTRGDIPDYQMSALAMAVFFRGLSPEETAALTDAMLRSGDRLDTSSIPRPKVDKHSTGGVGDKVSLVLGPLLAAAGAAVPMISGRGLGLTGGTLDKLESIPGYRTGLAAGEFLDVVRRGGCSIVGQTERLCPADRKLYALRDVTGTVPSIPLITASILSKKLAEGLDALVMDVKFGAGAFMKTRADARRLAASLVRVGREAGLPVRALLTDMNRPLGRAVGNALEVMEAVETLKGRGPEDLVRLTLALGGEALAMTGLAADPAAGEVRLREALDRGEGWRRFREMVILHGGDAEALEDYRRLPRAAIRQPFAAPAGGYVASVDAERIARAVSALGAGRSRADAAVDPAVGAADLVQVGERVEKGQILVTLHANDERRLEEARGFVREAFALSGTPVAAPELVAERIAS
jgi:pyrimidine-nucleoside phosphorylase